MAGDRNQITRNFREASSHSETVNLLLVDDDRLDVKGIQRALRKARIGNPIFVAPDGIEALKQLRGEAEDADGNPLAAIDRPYLILLDLNMPRMNGIEFLEVLRDDTELRNSIVFVLTTSDDDQDIADAYENLVAGYMLKQNAGEDFNKLIAMLDHYWRVVEFPIDPNAPASGH